MSVVPFGPAPRWALYLCAAFAITGLQAARAGDFDREVRLATAVQIALPLLAGICAARNQRGREFVAGFAAESLTVQGLKYGLGGASLNRRPNGGDRGFPSGHAALAMYGATSLARKCLPDKPVLGALAYAAAFAVAASRVHTRHHTPGQAVAGLAIGYVSNGVSVGVTPEGGLGLGFSMSF